MADAYWRFGAGRQQQMTVPAQLARWNRLNIESPSSHGISDYFGREDGGAGQHPWTIPIGAADFGNIGGSEFARMVGRPEFSVPPDANSTLFVTGLPSDCTLREVAHIFRPLIGFKEVRLLTRESKYVGGNPLVLCFVDFRSPTDAAMARNALQGYQFDELDKDSPCLRLQFARNPSVGAGGIGCGNHNG